MALRGQVVDLIRLHFLDHVDEAGRIRHVTVVQHQASPFLVRVFIQVIDAVGVQQRSAALDAVHLVPLPEQEPGQVSAVLPGDAGDQGSLQEVSPLLS